MTHGTRIDSPEREELRRPYQNRVIPKEQWGDGPWQQEPDRLEWYDEATGYPCLLHRNLVVSGTWCGYVAVPPGHPAHGKHIDQEPVCELSVHGGVTYAESCQGPICHTPKPGESDNVHWIGFDAAHGWDYMPAMEARLQTFDFDPKIQRLDKHIAKQEKRMGIGDVYRTTEYMQNECRNLASQLKALEG